MKKFISILLVAMMVVSLAVVGVNAETPEGTAVNNAAEFAAMTADGKYYLAADITLTATYETQFTGTLDGNGHKVTVNAPMFKDFSGTIKNLTVEGEVTTGYECVATSADAPTIYPHNDAASGAVAVFVVAPEGKTVVFENVVNNAKVNVPMVGETKAAVGGLYGLGWGNVTVTKCVNNGEITGKDQVGGLVGWADRITTTTLTVTESVNNGTVNAIGNYGGGLVGRSSEGATVIDKCVNTGNVNVFQSQAGGIVGYINHALDVTFTNCENNGKLADYDDPNDDKDGDTIASFGGIVGITYATANGVKVTIENCKNTKGYAVADASNAFAGGMAARLRAGGKTDVEFAVKNCSNSGDLTNINTGGGIVGQIQGASGKLAKATVEGCLNTGDIIIASKATSGTVRGAGILAHTEYTSFKIAGCTTVADITATTVVTLSARLGGMVGYVGGKTNGSDGSSSEITNSVQIGDVTALCAKSIVGGLCGSNYQHVLISNSYSDANVTGQRAGGAVGYAWGNETDMFPSLKNSVILGSVTATQDAAAFCAYSNTPLFEASDNYFDVALTLAEGLGAEKASVIGWDNKYVMNLEKVKNNYVPATGTPTNGLVNKGGLPDDAEYKIFTVAEAVTAGYLKTATAAEAVSAINTAAGATLYQVVDGKVWPAAIEVVAETPATCKAEGTEAGYKLTAFGVTIGCEPIAMLSHEVENGACKTCGALAGPEAGKTIVLKLDQNKEGKTLYFNGQKSGNFLACTENKEEAVVITVEAVEGGIRLYFMDGEKKMYVEMYEYNAENHKVGVQITETPTSVMAWNMDLNALTFVNGEKTYYMGTYGTFLTMSASEIKYITGSNAANVGVTQFPTYYEYVVVDAPETGDMTWAIVVVALVAVLGSAVVIGRKARD